MDGLADKMRLFFCRQFAESEHYFCSPQAQGNLLFAPHAKLGPHFPA